MIFIFYKISILNHGHKKTYRLNYFVGILLIISINLNIVFIININILMLYKKHL